jgi:hypothetical protein
MKIRRDIRNLEFIASVTNTGNKTLVPDFHRFHDTGNDVGDLLQLTLAIKLLDEYQPACTSK